MPKVSIIIPCYNYGQYIDEAVDSVLAQTFQDFEIIIVNDGSTDEFTNKKLENYNKPKTTVYFTKNQGVSAARNYAIEKSSGEYILPLDADDKIHSDYIKEAVDVLEANNEIGIVYCEADFFGDRNDKIQLSEFSIENILKNNMILCSALYRRTDYNRTTGYNSNMLFGLEDWDFWLSLVEINVNTYKIPKTLFYYRIKEYSRNIDLINNKLKIKKSLNQIYLNHIILYKRVISDPFNFYWELYEKKFEIEELENIIMRIKNSTSYKLGNTILKPFSFFKMRTNEKINKKSIK